MQLRWSGHLVRMDDEGLPKRLFYGDVATGSRRQGGQIRRYKDTLKSSLKRLQINPTTWEDVARDRTTWRRTVKTGTAIYEANRIAAAKVKREARKSQLRPAGNADAQPHLTCPGCQQTDAPHKPPSLCPPLPRRLRHQPSMTAPLVHHHSSSTAHTANGPAAVTHTSILDVRDITSDTVHRTSDTRGEDQDYTCPHCDRTFTSHIGLVGHLRIHHTEADEPVPGL
ncbi:hypothetical protein SprV_0301138200 [Sparganum proliferum]